MSQALVLAAHGSHRNPDSASPALAHAEAVRERGPFEQVRTAFWKDDPSFRSVLRTIDAAETYVVPLFVSEGYFVEEVLPRELGLGLDDDAGSPGDVTVTDPVGTHPSMSNVVAERARRHLDVSERETGLAVVGHGTERNPNSADAVYDHVDALREQTDFAAVEAVFMDQAPYVEDVRDQFETTDIAVVPLFIADGFHTRDEIPELLGLTDDPSSGYPVPGEVGDHRIWYTSAVGTDPLVPGVICQRAGDAGADLDRDVGSSTPVRPDAADAFLSWLEAAPTEDSDGARRTREWGQLLVVSHDEGYALRHREDRDTEQRELEAVDPGEFRAFVRRDGDGRFRPFAGERSLPTGWQLPGLDRSELLAAVADVYPGGIEMWVDDPEPVSFREIADRQTGIYERVADLSSEDVHAVTEAVCGNCAKRRTWDEHPPEEQAESVSAEAARSGTPVADGEGAPPCREPCSFLVAAAREVHVEEPLAQPPEQPDADVPPGDLTQPANRYRVRYRDARGNSHSHHQ